MDIGDINSIGSLGSYIMQPSVQKGLTSVANLAGILAQRGGGNRATQLINLAQQIAGAKQATQLTTGDMNRNNIPDNLETQINIKTKPAETQLSQLPTFQENPALRPSSTPAGQFSVNNELNPLARTISEVNPSEATAVSSGAPTVATPAAPQKTQINPSFVNMPYGQNLTTGNMTDETAYRDMAMMGMGPTALMLLREKAKELPARMTAMAALEKERAAAELSRAKQPYEVMKTQAEVAKELALADKYRVEANNMSPEAKMAIAKAETFGKEAGEHEFLYQWALSDAGKVPIPANWKHFSFFPKGVNTLGQLRMLVGNKAYDAMMTNMAHETGSVANASATLGAAKLNIDNMRLAMTGARENLGITANAIKEWDKNFYIPPAGMTEQQANNNATFSKKRVATAQDIAYRKHLQDTYNWQQKTLQSFTVDVAGRGGASTVEAPTGVKPAFKIDGYLTTKAGKKVAVMATETPGVYVDAQGNKYKGN